MGDGEKWSKLPILLGTELGKGSFEAFEGQSCFDGPARNGPAEEPYNSPRQGIYLKERVMRIVFDPGISGSSIPRIPSPSRESREAVVVISLQKDTSHRERAGLAVSTTDYEVRISEEALARDREVRAHEQAHLALLGGAAASPIIYDTARGPGGEIIATSGRIAVDMSEVPGDPEATLRKARMIIAAANAPGNPSAADSRTAARAYEMIRKAQAELREGRHFSESA